MIKISGALIWVVNDKFDLVVKTEIFKTLESLQIKAGAMLKPMVP